VLLTKLLLLFVLVPIIELVLLVEIGQLVGTLPTIALIIFTGVLGAFLVRRQGVQVLTRIRAELQGGRLPADSIFDGAIILVAGAFLVTPGILTDTLGFLCLIPATRRFIKQLIWTRMERALHNGQFFKATFRSGGYPDRSEDVIIIDHDDYS
jgi:UPF0716 protein FxsA